MHKERIFIKHQRNQNEFQIVGLDKWPDSGMNNNSLQFMKLIIILYCLIAAICILINPFAKLCSVINI